MSTRLLGSLGQPMSKFYAVRKGAQIGIYDNWYVPGFLQVFKGRADCSSVVTGYRGAEFKKFATLRDAEKYLVESKQNYGDANKNDEYQQEDPSSSIHPKAAYDKGFQAGYNAAYHNANLQSHRHGSTFRGYQDNTYPRQPNDQEKTYQRHANYQEQKAGKKSVPSWRKVVLYFSLR